LHFLSFHAPSTTVIYTLSLHDALPICPCYYYQKQFFSGKDHPLSKPGELMHYDLEVSGFPSSHAGHLVLLGLTDQDYPHCVRIRSEEHTSELQSRGHLVCRLLLEKKKK